MSRIELTDTEVAAVVCAVVDAYSLQVGLPVRSDVEAISAQVRAIRDYPAIDPRRLHEMRRGDLADECYNMAWGALPIAERIKIQITKNIVNLIT